MGIATATPSHAAPWLKQLLIQEDLASEATVNALRQAASDEDAWAMAATMLGGSTDELAQLVAAHFRMRVADLSAAAPEAANLVPEALARRFRVLPLHFNHSILTVATCNPVDLEAERELGFVAGRAIHFEVAPPAALQAALDGFFGADGGLDDMLDRLVTQASLDGVNVVEHHEVEQISEHELEATPVVRLTNLILMKAAELGASDIHLEPEMDGGRVRARVDGVLQPVMRIPSGLLVRVVSRIKILAEMDISDRLRPQDGKVRVEIGSRAFDLRVSTVPARGGEKAVIRILTPGQAISLEQLGLQEEEMERIDGLLRRRDGVIVVTGPTGSGKTTTLYAALRRLSSGELNISTVENPVEYELPGITQIQVQERQGVTFASVLRALLRQDPDVILVGEIRDPETAHIATQASMTGHLVLTTLHTNDAVGVISRMSDLGVDPGTLGNTLRGVVSQRLLRRLCKHCAAPVSGPEVLVDREKTLSGIHRIVPARRAVGCDACNGVGYLGRVPVNEVLEITPEIRDLIYAGAGLHQVEAQARALGMRPLRDVALSLVRAGITSLSEMERVLGDEAQPDAAEKPAPPPEPEVRGEAEKPARVIVPAAPDPGQTTVLVAEDDPSQQALLRGALGMLGYPVRTAFDGREALEVFMADPSVALILTDLQMEGMDGLGLVEGIRRTPRGMNLPIIVLTSSADPEDELALLRAGADDYLLKPVDMPRLKTRVEAVLRRAGVRAA